MKGSIGGTATTWGGTFTVEESANGTSYTPLHTFTDNSLNTSTFTLYTETPQASTRYIRFYFTNKTSGSNVALDEILLSAPVAGPAQEINVTLNGVNVPNGFTAETGNALSTDFTIENTGLNNPLAISGISLSGADAAQFSLLIFRQVLQPVLLTSSLLILILSEMARAHAQSQSTTMTPVNPFM